MIILAHGILGPLDELVYLGVEITLIVMIGIGWLRARLTRSEDVPHPDKSLLPSAGDDSDQHG